MSFKENTYQQMSFIDSFSGLTAREQKALENFRKIFNYVKGLGSYAQNPVLA